MAVKIQDNRTKKTAFRDVCNGDMFEVSGILYMKTAVPAGSTVNAVRINTGGNYRFDADNDVWVANVTVTIDG